MKAMLMCLTVVALGLMAVQGAFAASDDADAFALIYGSLTIANVHQLHFGTIVPGTNIAGSHVAIATDSTRTLVDGDAVLIAGGSTPGAASFTVSGSPNATYSIDVQPSLELEEPVSGQLIEVADMVSDPAGTGQLDALGAEVLNVGGTAYIERLQAPGLYSGTFTVTVDYN